MERAAEDSGGVRRSAEKCEGVPRSAEDCRGVRRGAEECRGMPRSVEERRTSGFGGKLKEGSERGWREVWRQLGALLGPLGPTSGAAGPRDGRTWKPPAQRARHGTAVWHVWHGGRGTALRHCVARRAWHGTALCGTCGTAGAARRCADACGQLWRGLRRGAEEGRGVPGSAEECRGVRRSAEECRGRES